MRIAKRLFSFSIEFRISKLNSLLNHVPQLKDPTVRISKVIYFEENINDVENNPSRGIRG